MTPWHAPDDPRASAGGTACYAPGTGSALFLYTLFALVLTWPLVAHLGDHLPLGNNDLWQNYWNFWHWKLALFDEHTSPYASRLIYQPGDVSLAFHTHSPANMLTLLPIAVLVGEAAAINCALLLGFLLAAWGAFLFCRELTNDPRASFLGGLLFGFLPQHFEQSLEHLNLASYQGMPFFLLFLVRLLRHGGMTNIALCGVCFAWNALYAWHNGIMVTLLGATLAVHAMFHLRGSRSPFTLMRELIAAAAVATVLCLPFLWPLLRDWLAGLSPIKAAVPKGIDPLFLFIPPAQHPIWGDWVVPLYARWRTYESVGFTCYLSLVAMTVTIIGSIVKHRGGRRVDLAAAPRACGSLRLWAGLTFGFVVLSCGAELIVAGAERFAPLPFALTTVTPVLQTLRVANRLVIPAALALAVVLSFAASALLDSVAGQPRWALNRGRLFLLLGVLLVVDLLWLPYPLRPLPKPTWINALADAPPGLLLNVPGGHRARGAEDLYFQTLHGRPIVGGYTSVPPEFMEKRTRELPWLAHAFLTHPPGAVNPLTGFQDVLNSLPIQVVVVHLGRQQEALAVRAKQYRGTPEQRLYNPERSMTAAKLLRFREAIRQICGPPRYADGQAEIYVPPQ